jgi:hypothetical protein
MGVHEKLPLGFSFAKNLQIGEALSNPTTILRNVTDDTDYPAGLIGSAVVDGTMIYQTIGNLTAGKTYHLTVIAEVSSVKVWEQTLTIYVR